MYIYNKIGKRKNITYYIVRGRSNSAHYCIIADLHKLQNHENEYEEIVAWVDKAKNIIWAEDTEHIIDKDYIKSFVIND